LLKFHFVTQSAAKPPCIALEKMPQNLRSTQDEGIQRLFQRLLEGKIVAAGGIEKEDGESGIACWRLLRFKPSM
jgi:hypothetical protein